MEAPATRQERLQLITHHQEGTRLDSEALKSRADNWQCREGSWRAQANDITSIRLSGKRQSQCPERMSISILPSLAAHYPEQQLRNIEGQSNLSYISLGLSDPPSEQYLFCPNVSLKAGISLKGRALPHYWSSSPVHPHPFTAVELATGTPRWSSQGFSFLFSRTETEKLEF